MSGAMGTLQTVLLQVANAIEPLRRELAPGNARATFAALGIKLSAEQASTIAVPLATAVVDIPDMMQLVSELVTAIESDDNGTIVAKSLALTQKLIRAITSLDDIVAAVHGLGLSVPPATIDAIPERLFNLMLVDALAPARGVNELLELLGVLERQQFNSGSIDPDDPPYAISTFHFGRLGDWFQSPGAALAQLYQWNDPAFDGVALLQRLSNLLAATGAPAFFDASATPPALDLVLVKVTPKLDVSPKGLAVGLRSDLDSGVISFGQDDWKVEARLDFGLPFTSVLVIQPTGLTFQPPSAAASAAGKVTLKFIADRSSAAEPYVLFGDPGGSGLSVAKFELELGGGFTWDGSQAHGTFSVGGAVSGGKLKISLDGADGFIGKLLSGVELESDFDFGLGYSTDQGLYFIGSSALEIKLPIHFDLGPVAITGITFSAGIQGQRFPIFVAADIRASLGPVQAAVEQIGVKIDVTLKDDRTGNAGPVDIGVGFKPPRGAGLAIDAGIVKGGGFLYFDPDHGEYGGALELEFADFLALRAIGLITTRMPDGSSGFSLLIVITAEFPGGLQLGYGFTLLGVGGIIGLNRTMRLSALMEGVRTGAVESVMFPHDVIANAPRILSDLKAFFPPQQGTFLIGPMAKIGWGTPTLISVAVGVIIEIPGNVAIVGVIKVALPTEDEAILLLQVNFAGAIEFDRKRIYFFASLYESRVLTLTIDGELGVLVAYGDEPNLVLTVGGFHPAYAPPPLPFPTPRRVAINILNTDNARIGVSGYFAVTSNTAQFGAAAELYFGFDAFSVQGHIGFDALFRFSPFSFVIEVSAAVSLNAFGVGVFSISLRFSLEGPTPWRARGTGSVSLLLFDVSADFDITWGEERDTTLPLIPVLPLLAAEIAKPESWRTRGIAGGKPLVILRALPDAESKLVLHPLGTLFVVQRAVPLDIRLDKIGSQPVADVSRCTVEVASSGVVKRSDAQEMFALGQFQNLDDAAKLSRPGFEREHAGVELGSDGTALASQRVARRSTRYEEIVIDSIARKTARFATYNTTLFNHFLRGASVSRSPLSRAEAALRQPYAETIKITGDAYAVASTRDNTAAGPTFTSQAQARDYLATRLAEDPSLGDSLHVIPATEVAA